MILLAECLHEKSKRDQQNDIWLAYWVEKIGDTYYFGEGNSCAQKARKCFEKVEQLDIPGYDKTPTMVLSWCHIYLRSSYRNKSSPR